MTITLGFVILMASYFALVGWLVVRLRGRGSSLWLLWTVPAVWVLIEWLRGWLFTGFPWLAMGYTQIDLPLKGFAPLLGIYGVSGLVVLSAALLNVTARLRAAAGPLYTLIANKYYWDEVYDRLFVRPTWWRNMKVPGRQ